MLKEKTNNKGHISLTGATPVGKALFCTVFTPNSKFRDEGEYSSTIIMPKSDPDVITVSKQLDAMMEKAEEMATELASKNKNPRKRKELPPCHDENHGDWYDSDGNPTGEYFIKARSMARGVSKSGEAWVFKPFVCDSQGKPFPTDPVVLVGNGSTIRLAVNIFPYATQMGYGLSIRLAAVQVLDLVPYNKKDAKGYGFSQTDGFSIDTVTEGLSDASDSESAGEDTEENISEGADF